MSFQNSSGAGPEKIVFQVSKTLLVNKVNGYIMDFKKPGSVP